MIFNVSESETLLIKILLVMMILDYLSGIANAIYNKKVNSKTKYKNETYRIYEDAISDAIGNKVKISDKKIEISYNSLADLNRIMEIFHIEFKD